MNDILDGRIRKLVADIVNESPPAAPYPVVHAVTVRPSSRHSVGVGVVGVAALLALVAGTILLLQARKSEPAVGEPGPTVLEPGAWAMQFSVVAPLNPDSLLQEVLAIAGVADATYVIDEPNPTGLGDTVTSSATESAVTLSPGAVAPTERARLTMTVTLLPAADALQVAAALVDVTGLESITLPDSTVSALVDGYFTFALGGAALLGGDPPVYQPRLGPAPRFDTSEMGIEVPLTPAASLAEVSGGVGIACSWPEEAVTTRLFHIGLLPSQETRVLVSEGTPPCLNAVFPLGASGGSFDFSRYPVSLIVGASSSSDGPGLVEARVPYETSVAVAHVDGGPAMWQRPTAGIVVFPTHPGEFGHVVIESYDAAGTLIHHMEERYPVSTPGVAPGGIVLAAPPFVWVGSGESPEDVALEFASIVLGWTDPVASVVVEDPSGEVLVSLSQPGTPARVDVWTTPGTAGVHRGIKQVLTIAGRSGIVIGQAGVSLEEAVGPSPEFGAEITISPVSGAASALVVIRTSEGEQLFTTVGQVDLSAGLAEGLDVNVGPIGVERYEGIRTVLVLYLDSEGLVIAAAGESFPHI